MSESQRLTVGLTLVHQYGLESNSRGIDDGIDTLARTIATEAVGFSLFFGIALVVEQWLWVPLP